MLKSDFCAAQHKVKYTGVPMMKSPMDYLIYQMILSELKPGLVIEVGTHRGGTALYLADLMDVLGVGVVHTIGVYRTAVHERVFRHPRICVFTEGWENYPVERITNPKMPRDGPVMVIEDSTHDYQNTLGVMRKFAPFVTRESYLIVEDGVVTELGMAMNYNGGPIAAISEFLDSSDDFYVDRTWCNFFGYSATFNTEGYLKRR